MSPRPVRVVVTGHDPQGVAFIQSDGPAGRVFDKLGQEGLVFHEIWNTPQTPVLIDKAGGQPPEDKLALAPPKGGARIRVLDIPPDDPAVVLDEVFEAIDAADNYKGATSDRHASFHRTETLDYGIVLEGELVLIMDEGEATVRAGDIVVQRGTNHGWANRTDKNCRIAFILIDGQYTDGLEG
ncbi:cupin domain-containing protein [Caulobacter hibisci]|uniref:Cupin domain-containing protein n=1 Tax=Caulobacter hibisci TaxID=2035993 RepID=A0ABS0SXX8_9CAUL|nr:cupin domain-containing protein [Caulobacter hibisci]MBI1684091.1 cupin domain-containing protein [Caulobacter hibisci]